MMHGAYNVKYPENNCPFFENTRGSKKQDEEGVSYPVEEQLKKLCGCIYQAGCHGNEYVLYQVFHYMFSFLFA